MRFIARISEKFDYNTVKNCWLSEFETEDKDVEEVEFYIELDTAEDVVEVSSRVGKNIEIQIICDEPMILI